MCTCSGRGFFFSSAVYVVPCYLLTNLATRHIGQICKFAVFAACKGDPLVLFSRCIALLLAEEFGDSPPSSRDQSIPVLPIN